MLCHSEGELGILIKDYVQLISGQARYAGNRQQKVSENAFQPYLKEIDSIHLDSEKYGQRLVINSQYIYCEKDRFVLKDKDDNEIKALVINQNADNVDTEDRIAKYQANPLVQPMKKFLTYSFMFSNILPSFITYLQASPDRRA